MFFKMAGILIFLAVCGIVTSNPDRSVDCRKFVFAPLCRGVAAKRATLYELMNFGNNESYEPPVKAFQSSMRSVPVEDNESLKPHENPFQPAKRPLSLEDYESFRKFMKPLEFAMRSIALQVTNSLKNLLNLPSNQQHHKTMKELVKPSESAEHNNTTSSEETTPKHKAKDVIKKQMVTSETITL